MKFYFNESKVWSRKKESVYQEINSSQLPLVLIGKQSTIDKRFLQNITVPVEYVCSNTPSTWGTTWWGKRVISPNDLPNLYAAYNALIIIQNHAQTLTTQLKGLSIPPQNIYTLDMYFDCDDNSSYFVGARDDLERVYSSLQDEKSRDTYEAMVHYRVNHDPEIIKDIILPIREQYFPQKLGGFTFLHDHEIFADAGAYTGDSIRDFIGATEGKYEKIYAFEPDPISYSKLRDNTHGLDKVHCFNLGVGGKKDILHFNSLGNMGSRIDENGNTIVNVDSLDDIFDGQPVTYIKMDIEGMECLALQGAAKTIKTHKPKLAICIYHSDHDVVEVPKLILELNPDYKLYIRQYANSAADTVCYAI
ncbi:FkbM family methyltransferase [bacterium D16-76]|nr:FkbM family methyltransferase [bacterium D16-76]